MKQFLITILLAASLATACKRNKPAAANTIPEMPLVAVEVATPAQVASGQGSGPEYDALHKALEMWVPLNDYPTNLSILVAAKMVPQLPTLPPGKKFVIDQANMRVLVVNQ